MKIAIAGSSGMIGQALLPVLAMAGHTAVPLVRRPARPGEISWDPATGTLDPAALAGFDGAINLAGANIATRWTGEARQEIRESRLSTTRLLAQRLAGLPTRPAIFISVSAVGYYGDRGDEILTESSLAGDGFLPRLAEEWEAAAGPAREAGIRVVHPRFGIVLTRRGGALEKMLTPFRLGLGGRLGSGRQWMSWIALDDLTAALVYLLDNESISGPVNFTAPGAVRNEDFTRALGGALNRPALIPVPTLALNILYGRDMPRETLLASARVAPLRLEQEGYRFRYPELGPALEHVLEG